MVSGYVPPQPPKTEEEKLGELYLVWGRLARYFHTPIPFFQNLTAGELDDWISVMNESIRQENEAQERMMRSQRDSAGGR